MSILMLAVFITAGCTVGTPKVENGDTIKIHYTGTLEDGTVFNTTEGKSPFQFTVGNNEVIKGIENAVLDMKIGEIKTVSIAPADAYGERDEKNTQVVERSKLPEGQAPEVGQQLISTDEQGNQMSFTILKVDDTSVTVDTNHPLAGKTLIFSIELVDIV